MAVSSPFQWGAGGQALSPQQAAARRKIADQLLSQTTAPTTLGAGLSRIGDALRGVSLDKQADEAEAKGAETRKAIMDQLLSNPDAQMSDYLGAMADPWVASDDSSQAIISALLGQEQQQAGWARQDAQNSQERQWALDDSARAREQELADRQAATTQAAADRKTEFKHDYGLIEAKAATDAGQKYINVGNGMVFDTHAKDFVSPTGDGAGPMVNFDDTSGIRKEVFSLPSYKNFSQALPIYNSMAETAGRNTRASDLNLVYGLGKIMDPTSVVREGEMVMVQNTASLPDWLQGAINSLNGGAGISEETRKAIMAEAYGRMKGYHDAFSNDANMYQGIAERYRINPSDIIPQLSTFEPWTPPETGTVIEPVGSGPALVPTPAAPQSTITPAEIDLLLKKYEAP